MGKLDLVWEGVQRLAELVVPEGATLTIRPGTRVVVAPGAPALVIRGTLRAEGTADRSGGIIFFPEGDWGGIRFVGNSKGTLRHVRLEGGAGELLTCEDSAELELMSTRFLQGSTGLRCAGSSRAVLADAWISEQADMGVLAEDRSDVRLERVSLTRNSTGVTSVGNARISLEDCRIQGSSQCGVNAMSGSALIASGNFFEGNHTAISFCGEARGEVLENDFTKNLVGVHAKGRSRVNLWRNRFQGRPALDVDLLEEATISAHPPVRLS